MKFCLSMTALLVVSGAMATADEHLKSPDTIVVSAIISDPVRGLNSEALVIRCLPDDRAAWQFRARKSFSGELGFAKEQFRSFATELSKELKSYSLNDSYLMDENVRSEVYVFTVLSGGRVLTTKIVVEDFFKQMQPSSILGKPLLDHIRRDVLAGFYLHGYLATTLSYDYETRGYLPGKPSVVQSSREGESGRE